jgi:hypothetical protein
VSDAYFAVMSTEVETSLDVSERAASGKVSAQRSNQRFLDFARNDNLNGRRYNFQAVFPPTIVRTARPLRFQQSNGELREAD